MSLITKEEKKLEMPTSWIEKRVEEASESAPVPDTITSIIKDQLNGEMRERTLSSSEFSDIARTLLKAMNDTPLKGTPQ